MFFNIFIEILLLILFNDNFFRMIRWRLFFKRILFELLNTSKNLSGLLIKILFNAIIFLILSRPDELAQFSSILHINILSFLLDPLLMKLSHLSRVVIVDSSFEVLIFWTLLLLLYLVCLSLIY
jgi:hypothetical protein